MWWQIKIDTLFIYLFLVIPTQTIKTNYQDKLSTPQMSITTQPININISKENKEPQYNEFKKYIIVNNIVLQEEVKEATIKIKDLESQIQIHEETEDKYDTRMRYLKGLLQNLNELKNDYSKISHKTDDKLKLIHELHKKK